MIKGVLFDKDGTLIDFTETFGPATAAVIRTLANGDEKLAYEMASAVHFELDDQFFYPKSIIIAGTTTDQAAVWAKFINRNDVDSLASELDALFAHYATQFVSSFADTPVMLKKLMSMGIDIGVATNDSEIGAINQLKKLGMLEHFPFVAGYDSGHGPKPHPGMVLAFAKQIKAEPSEIMLVGDSLHDMHCGRKAGAICVAVTTGMADHETLAPHCDHVLTGVGEVPALVIKMNQ